MTERKEEQILSRIPEGWKEIVLNAATPEDAAKVVIDINEALEKAHQPGLTHREREDFAQAYEVLHLPKD